MESRDRTVLYAEDEEANRRLMVLQLKRHGIRCDTASDGMTALERYRAGDYALVMLDQYMPGLNGSEVARMIRRDNQRIPIIAITSDESQIELLAESGFDRVLLKPLHDEDYMSAIINYLSGV